MRFAHVFTGLLAFGGLILSLLSLLATGSFLPGADIMTVNVFQPGGNVAVCNSTASGPPNVICDSTAVELINGTDGSPELDLSTFYSVYALNYCEGTLVPNQAASSAVEGGGTSCSGLQAGFSFQLSEVIAKQLPSGVTLADLDWPDAIDNNAGYIKSTSTAMVGFLVLAIALALFSMPVGLWGLLSQRRLSSIMATAITFGGFLVSTFAASCATALSVNSVNNYNAHGASVGVTATVGVGFLGMMWGAVAFMLGSFIFAAAQACAVMGYSGYSSLSSHHMFPSRAAMHRPVFGHHGMHGWDAGFSHPMAHHMTPMRHPPMPSPYMSPHMGPHMAPHMATQPMGYDGYSQFPYYG